GFEVIVGPADRLDLVNPGEVVDRFEKIDRRTMVHGPLPGGSRKHAAIVRSIIRRSPAFAKSRSREFSPRSAALRTRAEPVPVKGRYCLNRSNLRQGIGSRPDWRPARDLRAHRYAPMGIQSSQRLRIQLEMVNMVRITGRARRFAMTVGSVES